MVCLRCLAGEVKDVHCDDYCARDLLLMVHGLHDPAAQAKGVCANAKNGADALLCCRDARSVTRVRQ